MDDFYSSMKKTGCFESRDKGLELQVRESSGTIFAEALIPLNPKNGWLLGLEVQHQVISLI